MNKIALIGLFLFVYSSIFSQAISGFIYSKDNTPISNVNILKVSTDEHTHSDEIGHFTIRNANVGDTVIISHICYETQVIVISSVEEEISIILTEKHISLSEVVILPQNNAINIISEIDSKVIPVNSSQDILRQVPGLIIGQHAGGGKAEQMFLRGFDVDHGTDINICIDGLPVNMVSHAHGQGYADLHFVIPELVDNIDFGKGPYYSNHGNFNTAGYVNFKTKDKLNQSTIRLEAGQFNTKRILGLLNIINTPSTSAYIASEYIKTDGPFESPQNFDRLNLLCKYIEMINTTDRFSITLSHFNSKWDASGQIPQRSIDDGSITRFGAIDDTEGGTTERTNLLIQYSKNISNHSYIENSIYFSNYKFDLFSNFTFFLEDSVNGDQIRQKENRNIFGLRSEYNYKISGKSLTTRIKFGVNLRKDRILNNELSHTKNRTEIIERFQLGNIDESNYATYFNVNLEIGKFNIIPSLRYDYFEFTYNDALVDEYQTQFQSRAIFCPKLSILYNHSKNLQVYLKSGKGFHSNDTRVILSQNASAILPGAYGSDLGFIYKPAPRLVLNTAIWYLFMEQEFIYVGDAGVVEPSGKSERQGIDFSFRYQALDWLFLNFDSNYTIARSIDSLEGEDYIPLAPDLTLTGGINVIHKTGLYGGAHFRHIKNRPANEDASITAFGYTVIDLNIGYSWKQLDFGIQIQNLFNTEWNETQFATESRLQNEAQAVEEIHFIPGTPFYAKGSISYKF